MTDEQFMHQMRPVDAMHSMAGHESVGHSAQNTTPTGSAALATTTRREIGPEEAIRHGER